MNSELLQGFRLRGWRVEPLKGQVSGAAGERHLPPKAVDVLLRLAERPHKLVTREELLELVWGDGNGSQEALGHAVSDLRHAFDDHHDDPWLIQTLPKRGYRLICAPELDSQEASPEVNKHPKRNWWDRLLRHGVVQAAAAYLVAGWLLVQVADTTFDKIPLPDWSEKFVTFMVIFGFPLVILIAWSFEFVKGRVHADRGEQSGGLLQGLERNYLAIFISFGVAAVGAGVYQTSVGFDVPPPPASVQTEDELIPVVDNSIAVLRLETFDTSQRTKAFSDGLSEDIIDGLARIPGILVSSRGDSWSLPANAPSDLVRRRLRVANYIEGSVRFLDDKLKVVVQLINSDTGFHRFSRTFEIDMTSTGEMQREVTEMVIANLKLAVDTRTLDAGTYSTVVGDRDAYMLYMLGREAMHRPVSRANLDEAVDHFEQALLIDGDYPAAHAGLCGAHVSLYELARDAASIAEAETACATALGVAPRLPVVLNNVGRLYRQTGRLDDAERAYLDALATDERDAIAMRGLAVIRRSQQRYDEAVDLMQKSIELQPGNWTAINGLGNLYFRMGQFANAAAEYRKVLFLDPDNFITLGNLAGTSLMAGNFADARDALLRSIEIEENPTHVTNLGIAYYYLGDLQESVDILRRAVDLVPNDESNLIALADALHAAGQTTEALETYVRARELAASHLELAGDDVDFMTSLAWTTAMTGDIDRALSLAQRAVELDPAYPYSHYYEALVQVRANRIDEAIDACRLALDGGYPIAMLAAEPMLDRLRGDPRFARLLAKHNEGGNKQ